MSEIKASNTQLADSISDVTYGLDEAGTNSTIQLYRNSVTQIKSQDTLLINSNESVSSAVSPKVKGLLDAANVNVEEWLSLVTALLDETIVILENHVDKTVEDDLNNGWGG